MPELVPVFIYAAMLAAAITFLVWVLMNVVRTASSQKSVLQEPVVQDKEPAPTGTVGVILRGQTDLFDKHALEDGFQMRVLKEQPRDLVRRRVSQAEARIGETWLEGALNGLPPGVYRVQLISPKSLTLASITVNWMSAEG